MRTRIKYFLQRLSFLVTRFALRTKKNKVILDLGAFDGSSVVKFQKMYGRDFRNFKYYCFEANPYLIKDLKEVTEVFSDTNIYVINKAVWNKNERRMFYLSNVKSFGSSLMANKTSGNLDLDNPALVEALDFPSWIAQNLQKSQYVILKMDIEGAEYTVLQSMLTSGSMEFINELYIEFHHHKLADFDLDIHHHLVSKLKSLRKIRFHEEFQAINKRQMKEFRDRRILES